MVLCKGRPTGKPQNFLGRPTLKTAEPIGTSPGVQVAPWAAGRRAAPVPIKRCGPGTELHAVPSGLKVWQATAELSAGSVIVHLKSSQTNVFWKLGFLY